MASFEFNVLGQTYVANKELSEKQIKEFEEIRKKELEEERKALQQQQQEQQQQAQAQQQPMQEQVEPEQQQPEQPLADAPTDYDEFFNEAGEKHNINPRILKSIAQVESGFREDVITGKTLSEKGAEGIMQFMPATRKALEEKYNVPIDPDST